MYERNNRQNYSLYFKAFHASIFTIGSFLFAKAAGYLPTGWLSENNSDETTLHEKRGLSNATQSSLIVGVEAGRFATPSISEDIVVSGNYAFLTQGTSGLQIVDISNPNNSTLAASYNTTGFAHKVVLANNYAFIAADAAGLQIVNLTDVHNPNLLGIYMPDVPVTQLAVLDNKAYIGGSNGKLDVVDVSDPTHVLRVTLPPAGQMFISGNIAYCSIGYGLSIYNITDPKRPNLLGSYTDTSINFGIMKIAGFTAYLYGYSNSPLLGVLQTIDVTNANNPQLLGAYSSSYYPQSPYDKAMAVEGSTVYLLGYYNSNINLQIIDVTNPNSPQLLAGYLTGFRFSGVTTMNVVGSTVYILGYTNAPNYTLQIIDVSNSSNPIFLSNNTVAGTSSSQWTIQASTAYFVVGANLQIFNVSNPGNFQLLSNYSNANFNGGSPTITGSVLYIASNVLQIIDISNPTNPILLSVYPADRISNINVIGFKIYLSSDYGLQIIDASNLNSPKMLGGYAIASAQMTVVDNNIAYVLAKKLTIIDTSQPEKSAFETGAYQLNGQLTDMAQSANNIFFTSTNLSLTIIESSQFFIPKRIEIPSLASINFNFDAFKILGDIACLRNDSAIQIFNISNSNNVFLIAEISISIPGSGFFLYNMDIIGTNLYAASSFGLEIFDITNARNPLLLTTFPISGGAYYVSVSKDIAYVSASVNYLYIIDVSTPTSPVLLASHTPFSPSSISLAGPILYSVSAVFNVSDPRALVLLANVSFPGPEIFSFPMSTIAYRATGINDLLINEISNPYSAFQLGSYALPFFAGLLDTTENTFYGLSQRGNLVSTSVQFWKNRFPISNSAMAVTATDNYAYLVDINNVLHVINIKNLSTINELSSSYTLSGPAQSLELVGDFLYAALGINGVEIVDVSNPLLPQLGGRITANLTNAQSVWPINNQVLYVGDARLGLVIFDIPEKLVVVNNQLVLSPGQVVNITLADISARDTRQVGFYPLISFIVSNISNGQFVFSNNTNQSITEFTQQDIMNGLVQFESTNTTPSYLLTAVYGALTTTPMPASITFGRFYQMPVMVNNQLFINQGEVNVLSSANLSATVTNGDTTELLFTVNNIGNGYFQLASQPGVFISQFLQEQVINKSVQFIYLGSGFEKPFYKISVADGPLSTAFVNGNLDFDAAPQLTDNSLTINNGQTIVITSKNLQAIDPDSNNANLLFDISNITHGQFISNNLPISQFIQQDITDGLILFKHDGSGIAPSYAVSVSDRRITTPDQTPTVLFDTGAESNIGAIVGGVVGGVLGLGALLAAGGLFAKQQIDHSSRKKHVFAAYIWTALQPRGIDNFNTDKGKQYVALIEEQLIPKLENEGLYTEATNNTELKELAEKFAEAAKSLITTDTTCWGSSKITVDDLNSKIAAIAQRMSQGNPSIPTSNNSYMPTLNLGSSI